tara:strand:- start:562 stop:798 length:237 start_codon:yes stop_codon:yes gene_type:complete
MSLPDQLIHKYIHLYKNKKKSAENLQHAYYVLKKALPPNNQTLTRYLTFFFINYQKLFIKKKIPRVKLVKKSENIALP